jgi:HD-like signal output (HDOD) protein
MSWFKLGGRKGSEAKADEEATTATAAQTAPDAGSAGDKSSEQTPPAPREMPEKVPPEVADFFLIMEEHMNPVELEDMTHIVSELRQPPPIIDRLSVGLDDPDDLKEAILSSPTLSADVLRVVNSAAFAVTTPISSIEHAVTYLGTNTVKGLVMQAAVAQMMKFSTDVQKAAYMRLWRSGYAASAMAQTYAQLLELEHPSIYATRGLLAPIGDLALISARPELSSLYAPKSTLLGRLESQQRDLMANSAVLSALLAREWGLPEDLCDALRHALTPLATAPGENSRSADQQRDDVLLYLACRFGDAVAFGGLRDVEDFDPLQDPAPELFYLQIYLGELGLTALATVGTDRKLGRRVQHLVNSFSG